MPVHNYICEDGHIEKDVYFTQASGGADKQRECPECGQPSTIHMGSFGAYNRLMSTDGFSGKMPDPQTGVAYEHPTHKKQVLREMGLIEGNRMTKGDVEAETWNRRNEAIEKAKGVPKAMTADSEDDIMAQIDWDKVDRKASGDLNREVGDAGYGLKEIDLD